ncbi:uncharacterized protein PpBr36_09372 [Pyricularia pennisetigena]|uniref:uncharacterized protein n=1 Tax=Pyricularia pennisetigena TaxID=1578925 RepID=UPI001154D0B7|nr:uncharacterized protein PpBr36_09372 [Pyricularia pennisetigena]TLS21996.1 hypothetical protein PpBr36_09372 [Pyricularia pennisetigena]
MSGKARPIPVPDLPTWDAANLRTPAHCCFGLCFPFAWFQSVLFCPPGPFFLRW